MDDAVGSWKDAPQPAWSGQTATRSGSRSLRRRPFSSRSGGNTSGAGGRSELGLAAESVSTQCPHGGWAFGSMHPSTSRRTVEEG